MDDREHSGNRADDLDGATRARIEEIRGRLDDINEQLADLALDMLRRALDEGAGTRPPAEKTVTQARRAVEKASRLLDI